MYFLIDVRCLSVLFDGMSCLSIFCHQSSWIAKKRDGNYVAILMELMELNVLFDGVANGISGLGVLSAQSWWNWVYLLTIFWGNVGFECTF